MNKVDVIKILAEDKTLKEIELTSKDVIIKEVKEDNTKLAKQIEDLEKEAKDMLLYP